MINRRYKILFLQPVLIITIDKVEFYVSLYIWKILELLGPYKRVATTKKIKWYIIHVQLIGFDSSWNYGFNGYKSTLFLGYMSGTLQNIYTIQTECWRKEWETSHDQYYTIYWLGVIFNILLVKPRLFSLINGLLTLPYLCLCIVITEGVGHKHII